MKGNGFSMKDFLYGPVIGKPTTALNIITYKDQPLKEENIKFVRI